MSRPKSDLSTRFWSKVDIKGSNQCWEWQAGTRKGYGVIRVDGHDVQAHRISWELHHGRPVPNGMLVLHECDNKKCVNPGHLFLGTHKENMDDRDTKGRQVQGERVHSAKLTSSDVRYIRKVAHKFSCAELRKRFGIGQTTLREIIIGHTWKGV
jgi:hypothetical protein